uniref:Uncharacterized protein n=1 Tax=viral metagenome TaxID=1070528 RepID=A0A6M3IEH9_9ZZZZ
MKMKGIDSEGNSVSGEIVSMVILNADKILVKKDSGTHHAIGKVVYLEATNE